MKVKCYLIKFFFKVLLINSLFVLNHGKYFIFLLNFITPKNVRYPTFFNWTTTANTQNKFWHMSSRQSTLRRTLWSVPVVYYHHKITWWHVEWSSITQNQRNYNTSITTAVNGFSGIGFMFFFSTLFILLLGNGVVSSPVCLQFTYRGHDSWQFVSQVNNFYIFAVVLNKGSECCGLFKVHIRHCQLNLAN